MTIDHNLCETKTIVRTANTRHRINRPTNKSSVPAFPGNPFLEFTKATLEGGGAVKVLAMPPFDGFVGDVLRELVPGSNINVIPWPSAGLSRYSLMKDAAHRVRPLAPNLVLIAIPRGATAGNREQYIRTQMWIASNSLSRGKRMVHPSVIEGEAEEAALENDALIRHIVENQDLPLLDRGPGDTREAEDRKGNGTPTINGTPIRVFDAKMNMVAHDAKSDNGKSVKPTLAASCLAKHCSQKHFLTRENFCAYFLCIFKSPQSPVPANSPPDFVENLPLHLHWSDDCRVERITRHDKS